MSDEPHIEPIAVYHDKLFEQLCNLWVEYDVYSHWYGSETNCELMQRIDHEYFMHLRQILHDSIVLGISRLLDPPETCSKANLSIQRFYNDVSAINRPHEWDDLWTQILDRKPKFNIIRVKHLAHADYQSLVHPEQVEVDWISRNDILEMLELIGKLFCHYNETYRNVTLCWRPVHESHGKRVLNKLAESE